MNDNGSLSNIYLSYAYFYDRHNLRYYLCKWAQHITRRKNDKRIRRLNSAWQKDSENILFLNGIINKKILLL